MNNENKTHKEIIMSNDIKHTLPQSISDYVDAIAISRIRQTKQNLTFENCIEELEKLYKDYNFAFDSYGIYVYTELADLFYRIVTWTRHGMKFETLEYVKTSIANYDNLYDRRVVNKIAEIGFEMALGAIHIKNINIFNLGCRIFAEIRSRSDSVKLRIEDLKKAISNLKDEELEKDFIKTLDLLLKYADCVRRKQNTSEIEKLMNENQISY